MKYGEMHPLVEEVPAPTGNRESLVSMVFYYTGLARGLLINGSRDAAKQALDDAHKLIEMSLIDRVTIIHKPEGKPDESEAT